MQEQGERYANFMIQRQWLLDLSDGNESDLNRLFFQDMVLDQLSAEEKEHYMRLLLEPRPKTPKEALQYDTLENAVSSATANSGFMGKIRTAFSKLS